MENPATNVSIPAFAIAFSLVFSMVALADDYTMKAGDAVTFDGKNIKVLSIGKSSVLFSVNEKTAAIKDGDNGQVSGIDIAVSKITSTSSPRTVKISVSKPTTSTTVSPSPNAITIESGKGVEVKAGDKLTLKGKSIEVLSIGKAYVLVKIGDERRVVSVGAKSADSKDVGSISVILLDGNLFEKSGRRYANLTFTESLGSSGDNLKAGDTFQSFGKTIAVSSIGKSSVVITIDGVSKVLEEGKYAEQGGVAVMIDKGSIKTAGERRTVSLRANEITSSNKTSASQKNNYETFVQVKRNALNNVYGKTIIVNSMSRINDASGMRDVALIEVDGISKEVMIGQTAEINGVKIEISDGLFWHVNPGFRWVTLRVYDTAS